MKTGRPPSWNPVSALSASTWTEVIALTSKARLQLPIAVRTRVTWVTSHGPEAVLATFHPEGSAELRPWEPFGSTEMARIALLLNSANEALSDDLAVAAMDRYVRLRLEPDGRMSLPANLAFHLDAVRTGAVRMIVRANRLFLWSETAWQSQRAIRDTSLQLSLNALQSSTQLPTNEQ